MPMDAKERGLHELVGEVRALLKFHRDLGLGYYPFPPPGKAEKKEQGRPASQILLRPSRPGDLRAAEKVFKKIEFAVVR